MPINGDILLLLISTLAAAVTIFITMGFLDRIYRTQHELPPIFKYGASIAVGSGVWANHYLVSLSTNIGAPTALSWPLFHSWLFAVGIGAFFVYLCLSHKPKAHQLIVGSIAAGLCDLGLFYSSRAATLGLESIVISELMATVSVIFSTTVMTMAILQFQWVKTYVGNNKLVTKIFVSLSIAISILCIHFVFNTAFLGSSGDTSSSNIDTKLFATTIALGMISAFMLALLFVMFYEKHGKKLFIFSLFSATSESSSLQDSLTKLPNREAFNAHIESAKKRCIRNGKSFALAYIDLDHFKPINDNFGHHIGDAVLKITADRLNSAIRGCDLVARIGGDEFVAILEEVETENDIIPIAERIVDSIKEAYFIDHLNIDISCSVGIAVYPKDGDIEKLLVSADAAMYKAKDQGKNQYKFYDDEIESANDLMLNMQSDLCLALENKEFSVKYLPKIDCNTLTAIGAEALVRWNHPTRGEVLPNDFLPAAEHFGLIQQINDWVIDECCSMLAHAKLAELDLEVSINLSSHQFRDPSLVKNIIKTIKYYDLDPRKISFEIKETVAINNQNQFKVLLDKFKKAGIKVVLDDFGLLPMSLTYLIDLNIDEVKLDRSFIAMLDKDKSARALIDAIFKLTHALGFKATAEGIENEVQQEEVIELGCDYMQGFLFSEPVKEPEMFSLYKKLQFKQLQIDFNKPTKPTKKV